MRIVNHIFGYRILFKFKIRKNPTTEDLNKLVKLLENK